MSLSNKCDAEQPEWRMHHNTFKAIFDIKFAFTRNSNNLWQWQDVKWIPSVQL